MEMVPAGVMVVVIPRMVVMVLSGTRPVAQPRDHEGCADAQDHQARQQGEPWLALLRREPLRRQQDDQAKQEHPCGVGRGDG